MSHTVDSERRGPGRPYGLDPKNHERNEDMKRRFLEGATLNEIGMVYGITRERVRQILVRLGIESFDGGAAVRWEKLKLQKLENEIANCMARYGCTPDEYRELRRLGREMIKNGVPRDKTPIGAYRNRMHNCTQYGIPFDLTLWQFWTIWKESGHWNDRGQGNYGLCRKDTAKGFTIDNVFIREMKRASRWGEKRSGVASKFKPVP